MMVYYVAPFAIYASLTPPPHAVGLKIRKNSNLCLNVFCVHHIYIYIYILVLGVSCVKQYKSLRYSFVVAFVSLKRGRWGNEWGLETALHVELIS